MLGLLLLGCVDDFARVSQTETHGRLNCQKLIWTGVKTYRNTGNRSGLVRASQLAESVYGRPNPMGHYLYFRASQKEPFDILYFTPALTTTINLQDGSFSVIPELAYSPMTNLELRFRTPLLIGWRGTEYGEKQNNYRVELRLRYYFSLDSILESLF